MLNVFICGHCGNETHKKRNGHKYKYCSTTCYYNARYGEIINDELGGIRNPLCLEAVRLWQAGMSQREAAEWVGVELHVVVKWFQKYGRSNKSTLYTRVCRHCDKPLEGVVHQRKYCSETCASRAQYAKKYPIRQRSKFDPKLRGSALELYWGGLEGTAIAQHFEIPDGTVHSWIHDFGDMRKRTPVPEVLNLVSVVNRLEAAGTPKEWIEILHRAAPEGDRTPIHIVCGFVHGHASHGYYAAIVSEVLKRNPCDGMIYAFCSGEHILTLKWINDTFFCTKKPKATGKYVWPDTKIGTSISVCGCEFEYLLSLSKKRGRKPCFA